MAQALGVRIVSMDSTKRIRLLHIQIGSGVLGAIGLETFYGQHRLQHTCNRIAGIFVAIIALYVNLTTAVSVYIAGAAIIYGGLLGLLLPYELRGRSSI